MKKNWSAALAGGAFSLPFARRYVQSVYEDFLTPPGMRPVDFSKPLGAAALVGADSVSWRIFKNPITLFIGGVTAVILEISEPRIGHGIWQFSDFTTNPKRRLQRTGLAAMTTVYAAREVANAMIAGVVRMHERVQGVTDDDIAYRANDPELLTWVQATAMFGFMEAYRTFSAPLLSNEINQYYAESAPAAALYGAVGMPVTQQGVDDLMAAMKSQLRPTARLDAFLSLMSRTPILPKIASSLQMPLIRAAVGLVPIDIRDQIGIAKTWLPSENDRRLANFAAGIGDHLVVEKSPAVASCQRLGLPMRYLYTPY